MEQGQTGSKDHWCVIMALILVPAIVVGVVLGSVACWVLSLPPAQFQIAQIVIGLFGGGWLAAMVAVIIRSVRGTRLP